MPVALAEMQFATFRSEICCLKDAREADVASIESLKTLVDTAVAERGAARSDADAARRYIESFTAAHNRERGKLLTEMDVLIVSKSGHVIPPKIHPAVPVALSDCPHSPSPDRLSLTGTAPTAAAGVSRKRVEPDKIKSTILPRANGPGQKIHRHHLTVHRRLLQAAEIQWVNQGKTKSFE
jgi:hypothetical protein